MREVNIAIGLAGLFLFAANAAHGQAPVKIEFEVASVKAMPPSPTWIPETRSGGPGTADPGQISWSGANLHELLEAAYDVKSYQVSGPGWLGCCADRYTIVAKVPEGATKEQVELMWQSLLRGRFGVVVHHESRMFQADEMTLAKGASKLKETDFLDSTPRADSASETTPGKGSKTSPDDDLHRFMPTPGWTFAGDGTIRRLLGRAQSMADVAGMLAQIAGHPVVDKTGLTGRYDFNVELDLSQPCVSCVVAIALERELGLKLVKSTVQLDVIVVDHAEKIPTDN